MIMKHDFHVGDAVYLVNSCRFDYGTPATVVGYYGDNNLWLRMDLDKPSDSLHSCEGLCEEGYGWSAHYEKLKHRDTVGRDFSVSNEDVMSLIGGLL